MRRLTVLRGALASGGLLAAFGAASCCALPLMLASLGIGSTALVGLALVFGPYQKVLVATAGLCIFAALVLMWRHYRTRERCDRSSARNWIVNGITGLAIALITLTLFLT